MVGICLIPTLKGLQERLCGCRSRKAVPGSGTYPSIQEAEARGFLQVPGQPGLHNETLSQNKTIKARAWSQESPNKCFVLVFFFVTAPALGSL